MVFMCKGLCENERSIRGNYFRNRFRRATLPPRCLSCRKTMESCYENGTKYCYCCGSLLRNKTRRRTAEKELLVKRY